MSRDGEGKPDLHPARVSLDGRVEEPCNFGELHDLVEPSLDVRSSHPEYRPVQVHVLPPRQLGVETGAHLQQRPHLPTQHGPALGGLRDPRQELEQRGLACPVPSDDPYGLPMVDVEGDILHRPKILFDRRSVAPPQHPERCLEGVRHGLGQPAIRVGSAPESIQLRQALRPDHIVRHVRSRPQSFVQRFGSNRGQRRGAAS